MSTEMAAEDEAENILLDEWALAWGGRHLKATTSGVKSIANIRILGMVRQLAAHPRALLLLRARVLSDCAEQLRDEAMWLRQLNGDAA